ncbi:uncharacterized protein [Clytia hemisphaerica]|uniref:AAA+ ATPase domain-containing protein n=2 Tax=Clytia hemisphaerica TaxID=252671 RepID=A0A7M5X2C0_9CNID
MSTPLYILQSEYWIRVNLALEYCIKEALIDVLYNSHNDASYHGLPTNPSALYQRLLQCKQDKRNRLHKVLKSDQWNTLCPQNQLSNPEDWDITLLIAVLRTVVGLKPIGGWDIKNLSPGDQSIGAYLYLVRKLRNELKHGAVTDISDLLTFKTFWSRIEDILLGLQYKDMQKFYDLEKCSLDKHNSLIHAMIGNLMKDTNDNTKDIQNLQQNINQQATSKADKNDVQDLSDEVKNVKDEKADKNQLKALEDRMKNLEIKDESIQSRDHTVEHWNIYDPVSVFYGRKELIKNIHSELDSNQRVVLTGLGGVGKTQTVAKFTQLYKDEYQKVFWIAADNLNKTMDEIIRYFGLGQYLPKDPSTEILVKLLLSKVCKVEEKTLIVLDDVTNLSSKDFKSFLRHVKDKLSLLMTSQLTDWEDLAVTNIKVPCFEEYESVGFLEGQIHHASAEDISTLVGHLQCYPLALHQAICYIRKLKIAVPSYIEQFEACRKSVLSMKIKSFSDYDKTLLTVWDMAFHKIKEESKNAILVLTMMGYMDNKRINKKTFTYLDNIDEIDVEEIVQLLGQYSLVNERNGFLEIHALVQKMLRYCVEEQNLVEDECPKKLVMDTIAGIFSFKKKDL